MPITPPTRVTNFRNPPMRTSELNFLLLAASSIWRSPLRFDGVNTRTLQSATLVGHSTGGSNAIRGSALPISCLGPGHLLRTVHHDCDVRARNVSLPATATSTWFLAEPLAKAKKMGMRLDPLPRLNPGAEQAAKNRRWLGD